MLEATEILRISATPDEPAPPAATLTLTFDQRRKSRYRTHTDSGLELGWFLPRGIVLTEGDRLLCADGIQILVRAAEETVSEVYCEDALLISRAAYHLGNRHVPLDIAEHRLRYQRDSVLDGMLVGLGLAVEHKQAPFNPENGAYHGHGGHSHAPRTGSGQGGHSHRHSHNHSHSHQGTHEHSHGD